MQIIENDKIKEKLYVKKLENGLTMMFMPKKNTMKKFIIYGTNYGSIDNKFVVPGENREVEVPNGVAHYLEHKLFEQENGTNSLDVLTALGVNANAYTTNDHTAYLFEATENFYEALDELMDYVQHPYFTDENVEKERGIIGQEIMMYDDTPEWKVYLNTLKCMYKDNPINIDITGTKETIAQITKETLYDCYNTFYHPSNMAIVVCGDFEAEEIFNEIEKRLIKNVKNQAEIKRIYPKEQKEIVQDYMEEKMEVSIPLFTIGIKDDVEGLSSKEMIKRHISMQILLSLLIGKSSKLYNKLYEENLLQSAPAMDYEFSKNYGYVLIQGQSNNPQKVKEMLITEIEKFKNEGINEEDFNRIKKMLYADYVKNYNSVDNIATDLIMNFFKGISSFDYIEEFSTLSLQDVEYVLKEVFNKEKMVLSVINKK